MGEVIDGILDVGVEIDHGDDGVGPAILDVIDVVRNPHLDDLLARYVLGLLGPRLFTLPAHLLLPVQLFFESPGNIPGSFSRF